MLTTSNVILDALGSKDDWQILLDNKPVVMLYFAPENLALTEDRLRFRMKAQNGKINETELVLRLKANAVNIRDEIEKYDYWINTTDLNEVVPAVTSGIIKHLSCNSCKHRLGFTMPDSPSIPRQLGSLRTSACGTSRSSGRKYF